MSTYPEFCAEQQWDEAGKRTPHGDLIHQHADDGRWYWFCYSSAPGWVGGSADTPEEANEARNLAITDLVMGDFR